MSQSSDFSSTAFLRRSSAIRRSPYGAAGTAEGKRQPSPVSTPAASPKAALHAFAAEGGGSSAAPTGRASFGASIMENKMIVIGKEEEKEILARVKARAREHLEELERQGRDFEWAKDYLPKELPWNWEVLQTYVNGLIARSNTGLKVLMTCDYKADGKRWLHVSCSRLNRIPNWDDMKKMKELFIGDKLAIQVFPPKDQYVNINQYVLHLWVPVDDLDLPDFTEGTGSI